MKKRIFLVCLHCFFRLLIYESIAAIFWQSASYVLNYLFYYVLTTPPPPLRWGRNNNFKAYKKRFWEDIEKLVYISLKTCNFNLMAT